MAGSAKIPTMPSWAIGVLAVIGAVAGVGSAGYQQMGTDPNHTHTHEPTAHAHEALAAEVKQLEKDLDRLEKDVGKLEKEVVAQKDVDRLEKAVGALADAVVDLTIEVRTGRSPR